MPSSAIVRCASATAALLCLGATQATAATTWTSKIGTTATGSGTYTGASSSTQKFTDTTTGIVISCTSSTVAGAIPHLGSGLSGSALATATGTTWSSCTGAGLTFTVSQSGTWNINADSYAAPTTSGSLTNIHLHFSATGCSFDITGSVGLTFTNSTSILGFKAVPTLLLIVSNVSGCFGIVKNGDETTFAFLWKLAAKTSGGISGTWNVTSP